MGERTEASPVAHTGTVHPRRRPPRTQCTTVSGGGLPPSSPDRGVMDTLMDTPLQVRLQAAGKGAEATGGAGKGNGWCQRDWICRSSS